MILQLLIGVVATGFRRMTVTDAVVRASDEIMNCARDCRGRDLRVERDNK